MPKSILIITSVAVLAAGCAASPASRQAPQGRYVAPSAAPSAAAGVSITLTDGHISSIRAYYAQHDGNRSPGARGRGRAGGLPPGIARNLARGRALPPGIAKHYLPDHVVAELPALPSGLDYVIAAGKLVLVEAATQVVREVLLDLAFDS